MYRRSLGSSVWPMKRSVPSRHSIGCAADPVIRGNKKTSPVVEKFDSLSSFSPSRVGFGTRRARVAGFRRADPSTTLDKSCIQLWPHFTAGGGDRQESGGRATVGSRRSSARAEALTARRELSAPSDEPAAVEACRAARVEGPVLPASAPPGMVLAHRYLTSE